MTGQDTGENAPEGGGPVDNRPRVTWIPAAPPPPPAPAATPGPWPATGPTPIPGGVWATPTYAGGGRFAVPGAPGIEYAGALPRFVAYVIDCFIAGIVAGIVLFALGLVLAVAGVTWGSPNASPSAASSIASSLLFSLVALAIQAGYFAVQWASSARATLGMRLLNLRLGDAATGRQVDLGQAFRRWLAMGDWLSVLGVLAVLGGIANLALLAWTLALLVTTVASPTKQGLHDRFANTAMVQPAGGSSNGMVMGCVVILAAVVGLVVLSFIALIFLGGQVSSILSDVGRSI
jgi:hypothetical protein